MIDSRTNDREQLNWLAAFHFVAAGLWLFSLYLVFQQLRFSNAVDELVSSQSVNDLSSGNFSGSAKWYLNAFAVLIAICVVLNISSAIFLLQRKMRSFSLVVSGANCFHVPLGTVLGAITFLVLFRLSVRNLYSEGLKQSNLAEP